MKLKYKPSPQEIKVAQRTGTPVEMIEPRRCVLCGMVWNRCKGHGRATSVSTTKEE